MAHELTQHANGRVEAAFALKPAWHGLGTILDHAMTSMEAMTEANLSWIVDQEPVRYWDAVSQQFKTADTHFVNVRTDNGEALGVVGKRYEIVQNHEAFGFLDGLVADGSVRYESAFSLRGGRVVCVLARTPDDVQVAGETHKQYVLFKTSHDGSYSINVVPTDVRVVCQNTMRIALSRAGKADQLTFRHTRSVRQSMAEAQAAIQVSAEAFDGYKQSAEMLATVKLTDASFLDYVNALVPDPGKADDRGATIARNKRTQIMMNYYHDARQTQSNYPKTLLAAFHSTSQMVDHWLPKKRTAEKRFELTQMGSGQALKNKAWSTAVEFNNLLGKPVTVQVPAMNSN